MLVFCFFLEAFCLIFLFGRCNSIYYFLRYYNQKFINVKYKNKLIILDNASSHRNQLVKDLIKKDNNLLYAVPYQHYTNAIEGYFNVLKSRLQKKKGLTYDELVKNVKDVLDEIPIHIYKNLIKWVYDRSEKYVKRPSTRKKKPKKIFGLSRRFKYLKV